MTRLRMPSITAETTEGRLAQLTACVQELVRQLNRLLDEAEGGI